MSKSSKEPATTDADCSVGITQPVGEKPLTEDEVRILTESRTQKWKLEQYEFAYDEAVRSLTHWRNLGQFSSIFVAVSFLFLRYVFKEKDDLHTFFSITGTALSLVVMFVTIWGLVCRWTDQIAKKKELSKAIRALLIQHQKLSAERPVDKGKIQKWLLACAEFEEERKHDLATVSVCYLKRGYQHVANLYPDAGVVCGKCKREWKPEMNRRIRHAYSPFPCCDGCGVKHD